MKKGYESISTQDEDDGDDLRNERILVVGDAQSSFKPHVIGGIVAFALLMLAYFGQNGSKPMGKTQTFIFGGSESDGKKKEIGGFCSEDEDCENGHCCPTLPFIKKCHVCCDDVDCLYQNKEQPPAGGWGKPFCVDKKACSAFVDGESSQVDPNAYKTWMPSETIDNAREYHEQIVPRIMHSEKPGNPAFEHVWYFDLNEQEESFDKGLIEYNGTHITLPTFSMLHAGYAKSYHSIDEHETGITTLITMPNDQSLVADYPKVAFIEKYHSLTYDGKIDTGRGDFIKKLSDEGMKKPFNKRAWLARSYSHTFDLVRKKIIKNQVEAGIDRAVAWQARRFANSFPEEEVGSLNPSTVDAWASLAEKAKAAIGLAKDVDFERELKKSELHCKHFEEGNGVDATENSITFPLGRPMVTYSGEMVVTPVYYLGLIGGITVANYDEEKNVLQIYMEGYSQSRQYADPKFPGPTGLYVSPIAKGEDYYVDPDADGRSDKAYIPENPGPNNSPLLGLSPFDDVADFTLWARPRSETCDPDIENSDIWEKIQLPDGGDHFYEDLAKKVTILKGVAAAAPCANIWMRNDYGKGTNGFGVGEIGVWTHMLGETLDTRTKEVTTAQWWDNWDCFYKNKDPALCSAE